MRASLPGRAEELRRLRIAMNDAHRRVIFIRGETGVGKTDLAMTALGAAATEGSLTGFGAYSKGGAQQTFSPILAALSGVLAAALGELFEPELVVADLVRELGPAVEVLNRAGVQGLPPVRFELSLFANDRQSSVLLVTDAVLQLVRWLEGFGRPLILFIDDWRRAGPEGEALLASLLEEAPRIKLLLTECDGATPCGLASGASAFALDLRPTRNLEPAPADLRPAAWNGDPSSNLANAPAGARRMAAALAYWGGPAPRALLAVALQVSHRLLDDELARLAEAGLISLAPTTVQLVGALDENVLTSDGAGLARVMADRLRESDAPEAGQHALALRLAAGLDDTDPDLWRDRFAAGAAAARVKFYVRNGPERIALPRGMII